MFVVQMSDWMAQREREREREGHRRCRHCKLLIQALPLSLSSMLCMIHFLGMWINSENRSSHSIHLLESLLKVDTPQFLRVWQHDPWTTFMKSEQDAFVNCSQE